MDSRKVKAKRKRLLNNLPTFSCYYCNKQYAAEEATLEHILPRSDGGTNRNENLALACYECNKWRNILYTKTKAGKKLNGIPKYIFPLER